MRGRLFSSRFPYLTVRIELRGQTYEVEALLDTGFDDYVALPRQMIPSGAAPSGTMKGVLADGTEVSLPFYRGVVTVGDLGRITALVYAAGAVPLVGRAVSDHFMVMLDHGRQLIVEP